MKKLFVLFFTFVSSLSAFSQGKDVVDIAIGSADHTTLVTAVKAADLVTTLKGAGPFTLFAQLMLLLISCRKALLQICLSLRIKPNWQRY